MNLRLLRLVILVLLANFTATKEQPSEQRGRTTSTTAKTSTVINMFQVLRVVKQKLLYTKNRGSKISNAYTIPAFPRHLLTQRLSFIKRNS